MCNRYAEQASNTAAVAAAKAGKPLPDGSVLPWAIDGKQLLGVGWEDQFCASAKVKFMATERHTPCPLCPSKAAATDAKRTGVTAKGQEWTYAPQHDHEQQT